jgi:hypothetical protein
MTETNSNQGFGRFPLLLKLVVVWTGLLCLLYFLNFIADIINGKGIIFSTLFFGIVTLILTAGLANGSNSARIWTSIWVICGTLIRFFLVVMLLYNSEIDASFALLPAQYFHPRVQAILFLIFNIILNIGIIFILLRPSTKALFSRQPIPSAESTPQETP